MVSAARTLFGLPYRYASMSVATRSGGIEYESYRVGRNAASFRARYAPSGRGARAEAGSLDEFLVERCGINQP